MIAQIMWITFLAARQTNDFHLAYDKKGKQFHRPQLYLETKISHFILATFTATIQDQTLRYSSHLLLTVLLVLHL